MNRLLFIRGPLNKISVSFMTSGRFYECNMQFIESSHLIYFVLPNSHKHILEFITFAVAYFDTETINRNKSFV